MSRREENYKHLLPKPEFLRIILVPLQTEIDDLVSLLSSTFRLKHDSSLMIQRARMKEQSSQGGCETGNTRVKRLITGQDGAASS